MKNIILQRIKNENYAFRPYGTCSTAAETQEKIVNIACPDKTDNSIMFSLLEGATVLVEFLNANSTADATLNVNNTGAKPIFYNGVALTETWQSRELVEFFYDGTNWNVLNTLGTISVPEYLDDNKIKIVNPDDPTIYSEIDFSGLVIENSNDSISINPNLISSSGSLNISTTSGNIELNADKVLVNGQELKTPKLGGVNLLSNSLPNNLGNWSGDGANVTYSNGSIRGVVSGNYPRIKNFDLAGMEFEVGAEYTISFTARSSIAANRSVSVVTNTGSDLTFNFGNFPVTTSWKRYSLTATAQNSGSTATAYGLYIYCGDTKNSSSGQWLEIKEVKLEKGNIATDWTPTLDELQSTGSSGESTDTKNTVGSTYDLLGSPLFLVGVHGDEAHNQPYVQSYITGTGVNGTAQRRCWIEGNEASTVFNVPIINCDTVQCSNGITATKFSTTSAIGSSTVPVYINSSGVPTPCSLPTTVSCTNTTSNSTYYIPFVNGYTTASRSMCTDSGITYNPSTNVLTATTFSGSLKGNADTATVADINPIINMLHFDLEGAISSGSSGVNLYIRDSQSGAAATTGYPNNNWSYGGHGPIQHNIYIDLGDLNGGNSIVPQVQFVISNFDRGLDVWHNITYKATASVGDKYAWFYINCPSLDYKVFYKIKRIDNSTTPDIINPENDASLSIENGSARGVKLSTGLAKSINTSYPQIKRIPLPLRFNGNTSTYQEGFAVNTQCFQVKISRNYCENNTCVTNRITVEVVQVI